MPSFHTLFMRMPGVPSGTRGASAWGVIVVLLGCFWAVRAHAADPVLDQLDVVPDPKGSAVKVSLTFPMRTVSVQPQNHGDLLTVLVQPLPTQGVDLCALTARQTLLWSATDNVPLVEVTYEPGAVRVLDRTGSDPCRFGEMQDPDSPNAVGMRVVGTAQILLRFNRPVWFELPAGSDPRTLTVVVLGPTEGKVQVETTQEVQGAKVVPLVPEPANEPLNVPETPAPAPSAPAGGAEAAPLPPAQQRYLIALLSSREPFVSGGVPAVGVFAGRTVFSTAARKDGVEWYRLNVGFFADEKGAHDALAQVQVQFPEATVVAASDADRTAAARSPLQLAPPGPAPPVPQPSGGDRMAQLVSEARDAIIAKDYSAAIRKLQAVTAEPETPYRKEAQELLGVAHERALRYELAVVDYNTFLSWYPDGPDAARVRQRLAGLMTANQTTREALRESRGERVAAQRAAAPGAEPGAGPLQTDVMGGFAQNWRRENQQFTGTGSVPVTSMLQSILNVNARTQNKVFSGRARLDASYAYDLLANSRFRPRTQFSNVYLEAGTRDKTRLARVGRQSAGTGGVLGRFDGGVVSYALNDKVKLNVVGGLPVETTTNAWPNPDQNFYGVNADIGQLWGAWDFNAFFVEQRELGFVDRRAIGGEARYFKDNLSLFSLADYDVLFNSLNSVLVLANYFFPNRATVNATIDYRNSPYVMTGNAIQGQPVTNLDELHQFLPVSEMRDLAEDRAARTATLTAGGYYPFNDRFAVNADFTASTVGSTPAYVTVDGQFVQKTPSTGWEYVYATQLLVSNLPRDGDTAILGVQYADLDSANTVSMFLGTRNALTPQLRIAPTLRLSHSSKRDDTEDWSIGPDLQIDYRWKRNLQFQLEVGVSHSQLGQVALDDVNFDEYFVLAGYRVDF